METIGHPKLKAGVQGTRSGRKGSKAEMMLEHRTRPGGKERGQVSCAEELGVAQDLHQALCVSLQAPLVGPRACLETGSTKTTLSGRIKWSPLCQPP